MEVKMKSFAVVLIFGTVMPSIALSKDCSELLKHGIYDIRSTSLDVSAATSYASWFCDQKFSNSQDADSFGASLGFPFKGLPVKLGFESQSESWSDWSSKVCSSVANNSTLHQKFLENLQTINQGVLTAFTNCTSDVGLHVWLERTAKPKEFKFASRFIPPNSNSPKATVKSFVASPNVTCNPTIKKGLAIDAAEFRSLCTRSDEESAILVLNADFTPDGGGSLELPAVVHYTPPPPPPPPVIPQKGNPLFVGQTPGCNAAIVATHVNHLNCVNIPIGFAISAGPAALQPLYYGVDPNINAGVVSTKAIFNGGTASPYGYTASDQFQVAGSTRLFVVVGCGGNDGEVTTNPTHKNCPTIPIGWTIP